MIVDHNYVANCIFCVSSILHPFKSSFVTTVESSTFFSSGNGMLSSSGKEPVLTEVSDCRHAPAACTAFRVCCACVNRIRGPVAATIMFRGAVDMPFAPCIHVPILLARSRGFLDISMLPPQSPETQLSNSHVELALVSGRKCEACRVRIRVRHESVRAQGSGTLLGFEAACLPIFPISLSTRPAPSWSSLARGPSSFWGFTKIGVGFPSNKDPKKGTPIFVNPCFGSFGHLREHAGSFAASCGDIRHQPHLKELDGVRAADRSQRKAGWACDARTLFSKDDGCCSTWAASGARSPKPFGANLQAPFSLNSPRRLNQLGRPALLVGQSAWSSRDALAMTAPA